MDRDLLESSLGLVDAPDNGLTTRFYGILFERYPAVRPMFSVDTGPQAQMLREAIIAVLDHLDDADWLASTLHAMGRRHVGYGVEPEMYPAVAECMIAAMSELGGDEWSDQMTAAWTEALGAIAALMIAGATPTPGHPAENVA